MGQRRMFSPDIVGSDAFLEMPTSSRELYFQLGMYADDDGFVNPKKIIRMAGASDDDIKILLTKRFVLPFESGVVVIKHWLIHNMIRKDRYKETQYIDEKKTLFIKKNNAYTEIETDRQPNGNQMATQVKLGKVKLEGTNTAEPSSAPFDFYKYLEIMESNPERKIQVIAFYWKKKKIFYKTLVETRSAIRRHLRAAKEVANFDDEAIVKAYRVAEREYPERYTVETLYKILTR